MARLFNDSSNEYLHHNAAVISSPPFVLCGWFYTDTLIVSQTILSIGDASWTNVHSLSIMGGVTNDPVRAWTWEAAGAGAADSSIAYTTNKWHHAIGLFVSGTDRRVLLNGGSKGTNNTDKTPGGLDNTTIGASRWNGGVSYYFSGRVAETAIWNLSNWPGNTASDKADEFERLAVPALAAGYSPLFFRQGLVGYWPLGGIYDKNDGDHDIIGGYNMTPYNTPSTADHPPIIYPSRPINLCGGTSSTPVSKSHIYNVCWSSTLSENKVPNVSWYSNLISNKTSNIENLQNIIYGIGQNKLTFAPTTFKPLTFRTKTLRGISTPLPTLNKQLNLDLINTISINKIKNFSWTQTLSSLNILPISFTKTLSTSKIYNLSWLCTLLKTTILNYSWIEILSTSKIHNLSFIQELASLSTHNFTFSFPQIIEQNKVLPTSFKNIIKENKQLNIELKSVTIPPTTFNEILVYEINVVPKLPNSSKWTLNTQPTQWTLSNHPTTWILE